MKVAVKKINYLIAILITGILCLSSSCKKFIDIDPPIDAIETDQVFGSDKLALEAMTGLYSKMMQTTFFYSNGGSTIYPALSSDEIQNSIGNDYSPFYSNSIAPNNSYINDNFWGPLYSHIYQANLILEGIQESTALSLTNKSQIEGEARFIRAFCYFYLVNYFGDVPITTVSDYNINAKTSRSGIDDVYKLIESDLTAAVSLLTDDYRIQSRMSPNKETAKALLARVYLYEKKWDAAFQQANDIIKSGIYSLEPDVKDVFKLSSTETIWQLSPVIGNGFYNTVEGSVFIPWDPSLMPDFIMSSTLFQAFENNDLRKISWLDSSVVDTKAFYYPAKYKVKFSFDAIIQEANIVFRLAEQYLIRAEALTHIEKTAEANIDLNTIRNRAGLNELSISNENELLTAIDNERRIELFAEWGHRWFDLKRTGQAAAILSVLKPKWKSSAALYPIPFLQLQLNPSLTQNEGY